MNRRLFGFFHLRVVASGEFLDELILGSLAIKLRLGSFEKFDLLANPTFGQGRVPPAIVRSAPDLLHGKFLWDGALAVPQGFAKRLLVVAAAGGLPFGARVWCDRFRKSNRGDKTVIELFLSGVRALALQSPIIDVVNVLGSHQRWADTDNGNTHSIRVFDSRSLR
jgi:hypothetical protein